MKTSAKKLDWRTFKAWGLRGITATLPNGEWWTIIQRQCGRAEDAHLCRETVGHGLYATRFVNIPGYGRMALTARYCNDFDEVWEFIDNDRFVWNGARKV